MSLNQTNWKNESENYTGFSQTLSGSFWVSCDCISHQEEQRRLKQLHFLTSFAPTAQQFSQ